jgi:hypothetical protein
MIDIPKMGPRLVGVIGYTIEMDMVRAAMAITPTEERLAKYREKRDLARTAELSGANGRPGV